MILHIPWSNSSQVAWLILITLPYNISAIHGVDVYETWCSGQIDPSLCCFEGLAYSTVQWACHVVVLTLLRVPCLDSSALRFQRLVNKFQNGKVCEGLCISEFANTSEHESSAVRQSYLLVQARWVPPDTHVSVLSEMQSWLCQTQINDCRLYLTHCVDHPGNLLKLCSAFLATCIWAPISQRLNAHQ